ncbi:MAG: hypothetical protein MI748_11510 [Opitutales bacterium]|nr:hypothetical protein [Opitutales bacterium]
MMYPKSNIRTLTFCCVSVVMCFACTGAEKVMEFNIEADKARKAIRAFGKQSRESLLYKLKDLKDVITNEVVGNYSPSDALELLLEGTPLSFDQDVETGAFAIFRLEEMNSPISSGLTSGNLEDPANTNPKQHTDTNMNKKKSFLGKLLSGLAGIVVVTNTSPLSAQDEDFADEDVYELSPFVIAESENVGYLATTTLAGTRVKSNLSDLGSAISVLTPEVFADTGATDAESILPYSLNVEVAGVQGNFADTSSAGANRVDSNSVTQRSQGATRVRGLSNALLARGLFQTDIPFDSYNTSSITVNRGPNSLLFGATTPGGVVDQSLNQAVFGKDFGKVEIRIGKRKSHREVVDYNKVLIDNRLAVRVSLLNDEFNYQQKPTYKKDKRAYLALNAVLFEGTDGGVLGRTTIRANTEFIDVDSNPPKIIPPGDSITPWFQAPSRSIETYTGTTLPGWVDNYTPKTTIDNRRGIFNEGNLPLAAAQPYFINMSVHYQQPNSQVPSLGLPNAPHVTGVPARTLWRGQLGGLQRVDLWGSTSIYNGQPFQWTPGFTVPVITDRRILDNQKMAISGDLGYRNFDIDVQNIALEQELFDGKAGIEIAYDNQSYENDYYDPFSGGGHHGNAFRSYELRVDVTEHLPDGTPNPNLGKAYMVDIMTPYYNRKTDRETTRVTAFYDLDFTENDGFSRWFGRHVFTGFYSHSTIDSENRDVRHSWGDTPGTEWPIRTTVNARLTEGRRTLPIMVYLTESLLGPQYQNPSDVKIANYMTIRTPQPGDVYANRFHPFFATPANTNESGNSLYEEEYEILHYLHGGNALRRTLEAKALSWQSYWFDGNLVGLIGMRNDRFKTIENISLGNFTAEYSDANSDGRLADGSFDGRRIRIADEDDAAHADQVSSVNDDTMTWSLVAHVPESWSKFPLAGKLSFHYNESETFVPSRTRRDYDGNELGPETGETTEYGFTVKLFDERMSVRVNWFELTQNNATASGGPSGGGLITGWLNNWKRAERDGIAFEDALLVGRTTRPDLPANVTSYAAMYDLLISLAPQAQRDLFNYRLSDDGETYISDPNPGQVTLTNAKAEGFEIDVVGNVTENWRVMFNYGQQETTPSNSAPIASRFTFAVRDNLAAAGLTDVSRQPSVSPVTFGNLMTNQVNTVVGLTSKDGTVSLEQRKHRVNLLSTYSFLDDSRLNGLTVGGAIRWQSSVATGYESFATDGVVTPNLNRPYMGPEELNGDVWVSYKRKIELFNTPLDWKIQLNVRNAIGSDDYIPVITNPDGSVAVVRNPPTQEWFLTNTFSF